MSNDLPDLIDPWRAVAQGQQYRGRIAVSALPRLRALVADSRGELSYSLEFARDGARRAVAHVETRGLLRLQCQRCLRVMDWPVAERTVLALVQGLDEAAGLPDHYDPLMIEEALLRPRVVIEDEALLAIPAIARHPRCDGASPCLDPDGRLISDARLDLDARLDAKTQAEIPEAVLENEAGAANVRAPSPFAVLAEWKANHR